MSRNSWALADEMSIFRRGAGRERGWRVGLALASGLLYAAFAVWLAASPPAGAQDADRVDAPVEEAAGKWATNLLRDILTRQSIHGFAAGQKLALQPLDPLETGLSDRQRWQVYDWMVNALQKAATPHYTVVNRARVEEVYRAIEQSGSDSRDVMKEYLEVLKKQEEARINIACRSNAFRGGRIVLNCDATDIDSATDLASGHVAFREDWLPLPPLTLAVNAIAGRIAAKLGGLEAGRIGEIRIVEESADRETRLSKHATRILDTGISERMGRYSGWQGIDAEPKGPVYRLEGELLWLGERKLDLYVQVYSGSGDSRVLATREYIDPASVSELRERTPTPARDESADAAGEGGAVPAAEGGDDPASVKRAMYMIGMDQAFEDGHHAEVLDYVGRLEALGGRLPARAEYFRGAALFHTDRPGTAAAPLLSYVKRAGSEGRWHKDALRLLLEVEKSDNAAFERAKASDTVESYAAYLSSYPSGRHAGEASRLKAAAAAREDAARKEVERRAHAREDAAFERAKASDTAESYAAYLSSYPSGRHAGEASRLKAAADAREEAARKEAERQAHAREDEAFGRAKASDTAESYAAYLSSYPSGRHAGEASRLKAAAAAREEAERRAREEEERLAREEALRAGEASLGLGYADRVLVQHGLASLGYVFGAADGIFGRRTREVLVHWQARRGLEATGYLTRDQADALVAAAREAEAKGPEAGSVFRDCAECPEMVVVPAGSFRRGSPPSEEGRDDDEGPVRRVTIGYRFAVGVNEVTLGEFARFVEATGRSMGNACWTHEGGEWEKRSGRHWRHPGFGQTDAHPVVCVDWNDAQAYVRWLSGETGKEYRLLSEAEWEYVARAGTETAWYWGESESGPCRYANGADASTDFDWRTGCNDGHARTAPVGSFGANGFGLHDMLGNVWEWVADCWNASYAGAPSDGSAWESGNCDRRVLRGGSWGDYPGTLRAANRIRSVTGNRHDVIGFRVSRTLAR